MVKNSSNAKKRIAHKTASGYITICPAVKFCSNQRMVSNEGLKQKKQKTAKKSGGLVTTDKLLDQYLKQSEELENLTKIPKEITSDTFVNDIAKDLI